MNPAQLAALKAEITTDPLAIGYAGKTSAEIHDQLASWTTTVPCNIPLADLQALLMQTVVPPAQLPVWWTLEDRKATSATARMAFDLFNSRLQSLDSSLPFVSSSLAALKDDGILDQGALDAIMGLATKTVSRGELLLGFQPSVLDIELALL